MKVLFNSAEIDSIRQRHVIAGHYSTQDSITLLSLLRAFNKKFWFEIMFAVLLAIDLKHPIVTITYIDALLSECRGNDSDFEEGLAKITADLLDEPL